MNNWKENYKLKLKNPEYYDELERLEKYYRRTEKIHWVILCLISAVFGFFIGVILNHIL
jgi:hypothetical protein